MNCHQAPWTETIGIWSNCHRTLRNGTKLLLRNDLSGNPCVSYSVDRPATRVYKTREGETRVSRVEIDLGHIGAGIVREDLLKMTELQMALDAAVAEIEALRAENESLKKKLKIASLKLNNIAGVLYS